MTGKGTMHLFIVYVHPSEQSLTREVRDAFIRGLEAAHHTCEISDLYAMEFRSDLSEEEYLREALYDTSKPLSPDVAMEQEKINRSDAIVFIYPVFWTEAPAKLVGWFNRVWTYGFAYGNRTMKQLEKALVLCCAGNPLSQLHEYGHDESMKTVMLGDRIFDRARRKEMIILDGTSRHNPQLLEANRERHLATAFNAGKFF